jgi:RecB family exonuclease
LTEAFDDNTADTDHTTAEQQSLELFANNVNPDTSHLPLPSRLRDGDELTASATQIGDYLRCPQDFYYRHVLGVPAAPHPAASVGSLIHGFIQRINQAKRGEITLPPLSDLLQTIQDEWPKAGFTSAVQRERALKSVKTHFKQLYQRLQDDPVPTQIEAPFRARIPAAQLTITGRIDAVFESDGGVEIRDYKTGMTVTSADKAKSRAQKSEQLTLYALAWRLLHGEAPAALTLDFVETGQVGSTSRRPSTLDKRIDTLTKLADDLRAGRYPPGRDHTYCRHPIEDD